MKKFSKISFIFGFVMFLVVGCTETDIQPQAPVPDNTVVADDVNARKSQGIGQGQSKGQKAIVEEVTWEINGIPFDADLLIREFIVEGEAIYAVSSLSNITGSGLPNKIIALEGKTIF